MRLPSIFHGFRLLIEAMDRINQSLDALTQVQQDLGPARERLEALELSRVRFEAECEGLLLKAEGKLRAVTSAEQRERQLKRTNQRLADSLDLDGEMEPEGVAVLRNDAPAGQEEGLQPVRLALAKNDKAHAVRAKFGI